MNKLSDLELELIKKIAKIEGKTFVNYFGDPFVQNGITLTLYNLLTDKAMLWDLMVKHDVDVIHYDDGGGLVLKGVFEFSFYDDGELPRAILECIGANNG